MKKLLSLLVMVMLILSLGSVALADDLLPNQSYFEAQQQVDISDDLLLNPNYIEVQQQVDKANAKIDNLVAKAIVKAEDNPDNVDKIIDNLVKQTNKIADKTIKYAAKKGIEVYCEYEDVEIGGKIVSIDPLRIRRY